LAEATEKKKQEEIEAKVRAYDELLKTQSAEKERQKEKELELDLMQAKIQVYEDIQVKINKMGREKIERWPSTQISMEESNRVIKEAQDMNKTMNKYFYNADD